MEREALRAESQENADFHKQTWESFARVTEKQARPEEPRILGEFGWITSTDIVLDVACGTGRVAEGIKPMAASVFAVDLLMEAVAVTRSKGIETAQASALALPFDSESFDCVICNDILHSIPPALTEPFLGELVRVSRDRVLLGYLRNRMAPVLDLGSLVRGAVRGRLIDAANINRALYRPKRLERYLSTLGAEIVDLQPASRLVALYTRYPWYKRLYRVRAGRIGLFGWLIPAPYGLIHYDLLIRKVG